jgi:hypothetical protein
MRTAWLVGRLLTADRLIARGQCSEAPQAYLSRMLLDLEPISFELLERLVQSRVEICFCVDLLHNLASELAGRGHQPLAQFLVMAARQKVWI